MKNFLIAVLLLSCQIAIAQRVAVKLSNDRYNYPPQYFKTGTVFKLKLREGRTMYGTMDTAFAGGMVMHKDTVLFSDLARIAWKYPDQLKARRTWKLGLGLSGLGLAGFLGGVFGGNSNNQSMNGLGSLEMSLGASALATGIIYLVSGFCKRYLWHGCSLNRGWKLGFYSW